MESIGKYLQEQRENLKLSIEEVSQQTRIKTYIIEQIESDDYSAISEVGYIKVMIITYCRFLQADTDLIQKKLSQLFDKPVDTPLKITSAKNQKVLFIPPNAIYFVLLVLLIVFLTFYIVKIYQDGSFSFDVIRNQLATTEVRPRTPTIVEELPPDTLWVQQRLLFHEANNIQIDRDIPEPIIERLGFFNRSSNENIVNTRVYTSSRIYLQDRTNYIGEFIFKNQVSPLNPEIGEVIFKSDIIEFDVDI
ncbi:MAG: helix-turn-helix domain-containing protein [Candidatus Cloacimonetes bacterium]|nr:helix-turn-helix domain-containing protein [Candidatus Cloacimonadota bacterium]